MTSFGRKKTKSNCLANLPRTISQTSSLFRQSQHKRKIRDKNKRYCRQNKCSDLTCTKKYALTEGPKREGELMWATRSAPPVILCLLRACCCFNIFQILGLPRHCFPSALKPASLQSQIYEPTVLMHSVKYGHTSLGLAHSSISEMT